MYLLCWCNNCLLTFRLIYHFVGRYEFQAFLYQNGCSAVQWGCLCQKLLEYFFIYFGWPSAVNLIEAKQKPTLFYNLPYKYEGKIFLIVVYSVGLRSLEDRGLFLVMGLMSRHGGQRPRLSLRRVCNVLPIPHATLLCSLAQLFRPKPHNLWCQI